MLVLKSVEMSQAVEKTVDCAGDACVFQYSWRDRALLIIWEYIILVPATELAGSLHALYA